MPEPTNSPAGAIDKAIRLAEDSAKLFVAAVNNMAGTFDSLPESSGWDDVQLLRARRAKAEFRRHCESLKELTNEYTAEMRQAVTR